MYNNSYESNNQTIENNGNDLIDLKKLFNRIKKNKELIISLTSIATFISIIYSLLKPSIWKGEFQIVVQEKGSNGTQQLKALSTVSQLSNLSIQGVSRTQSQQEILSSPSVLKPVYEFVKEQKKNRPDNINNLSFKNWRNNYLTVKFKKGTNILDISFIDKDKKLILETLEMISSQYQNYSKRDRQRSINNGIKYLKVQEEQLKKKSNESLKKLNAFSISNGLGDIDGFVKLDSNFNNTNQNITSQIQNIIGNKEILNNKNSISNSGAGQRYSSQFSMLEKLEAQYIILSANLTSDSKTLSTLKASIDKIKESLKRPNEILLEFRVLKRIASRDENILKDIESKLLALKIEKVRKQSPWELISEPTVLDQRISPRRKQMVSLTFIISLISSFFIAKFKNFKSDLIYDTDFLKYYLKFNYLGKLYEDNKNLNEIILKKLIEIFNTETYNIIYLNYDSFFNKEIKCMYNLFPNNFKYNVINSDSLRDLESSSKIILISDPSNLSKKSLSEIKKFLDIYENQIIGWLNIEKTDKS